MTNAYTPEGLPIVQEATIIGHISDVTEERPGNSKLETRVLDSETERMILDQPVLHQYMQFQARLHAEELLEMTRAAGWTPEETIARLYELAFEECYRLLRIQAEANNLDPDVP